MAFVYLDSAATSLWRPMAVAEAVSRSIILHAGYGRNQSSSSDSAAREIFACREAVGRMFNVPDPANVVFCLNATHALNTAIFGLYKRGRSCLISGYEHNAVRRPLVALAGRGEAELRVVKSRLFDREDAVWAFRQAIEECDPGLVVCTAVGNVFGNLMPLEEIGRMCKSSGASFVVDASQAAGSVPVDMEAVCADAICMPGHKGLMGPTGTGVLLLGKKRLRPLLFGGTGTASEEEGQPEMPPERFESGTLNVCGICGLGAAVAYLEKRGAELHLRKRKLCRIIGERLLESGFRVFGPERDWETGIFSFDPGFDSEIASGMLANRGIVVRGGLHCAPLAHESAGTLQRGTVRVSPDVNLTVRAAEKAADLIVKTLKLGRA